jgi:hypothetical protein
VRGNALVVIVAAVVLLIAFLGNSPRTSPSGGAKITINVVPPPIRTVIMSPTTVACGNYGGGKSPMASTSTALGFPNGTCSAFPIKITTGTAEERVGVFASLAIPADGGTQWSLCEPGVSGDTACTGSSGTLPGADQFMAQNFAAGRPLNELTGTAVCDPDFSVSGCLASPGQSQTEGVKITGPSSSKDSSQSWTVTVSWIPIP